MPLDMAALDKLQLHLCKAQAMLDEFKIVNHSIQQLWVNLQEFWTLPPGHSYKVNVDGAVFAHI